MDGVLNDLRRGFRVLAYLGVKTIDWKNQMVIHVGIVFNTRNAVSKNVEVSRLDVVDFQIGAEPPPHFLNR